MKTYNCTCVIGGGGYVTLYGSLFLVQVHAQGLTRVFSMNFDRVLERAFRHSLLYTKVSYIVPDKINPWIITGMCIRKFALLIHISGAETERRLHLSVCSGLYTVVLCRNVDLHMFVVFEQLSSMVTYTTEQMCLLCNELSRPSCFQIFALKMTLLK